MLSTNKRLKTVGFAANPTGSVTTTAYYFDDTNIPFEKITITKDSYGLISSITKTYHGGSTTYSYDSLYRLTGKTTKYSTNSPFEVNYTYNTSSGNIVRNSLKQEFFKVGSKQDSFAYTYYDNGNVATVSLNGNLQCDYLYDEQNRLIRERNYALGFAREYTYDCGGNISAVKEFAIVNGVVSASPVKADSYNYSVCTADCGHSPAWKDQLKSYNNQVISYDESGNPLVYFGKNLTWHGRKLKSVNSVNMEYDYNGLRVKKGDKIFFWQNGNLIAERWVEKGNEKFIYYYYDESGVSGFRYDNTDYHYQKNIFGDIIAIYTANGQLLCRYVYNAWGEHKIYNADGSILSDDSNNIGNLNPIRYRGYYYDEEFALYYLQSRYYDPALGRFISPDGVTYLDSSNVIGLNLYAYCGNNPVLGYDPNGTWDWKRFGKGLLIAAAATAAIVATVATLGAGSVAGGMIIGATIGAAGNLFSQAVIENKSFANVNYWQVAVSGISGGLSAIPGVGLGGATILSLSTGFINSLLNGDSLEEASWAAIKSAGLTLIAGNVVRSIGVGKIIKIGKGNYIDQKLYLDRSSSSLAGMLSCFNPIASKTQGLLGFIFDRVGLSGLSQIASDTAGKATNMLFDILTSLLP